MKRYEYKFVEVPNEITLKTKVGEQFARCKEIILAEAENGWRLKQVVTPYNEKIGVFGAAGYQIIFERESV